MAVLVNLFYPTSAMFFYYFYVTGENFGQIALLKKFQTSTAIQLFCYVFQFWAKFAFSVSLPHIIYTSSNFLFMMTQVPKFCAIRLWFSGRFAEHLQ